MPLPETVVPIHFVLCIERTGSSMLSAMFNSHPELVSPSEEPFALYLHHFCRNKTRYTDREIDELILFFQLTSEKNLDLYFSPLPELRQTLIHQKEDLPFEKLCRLVYLHFYPLKPKENISHIIDKQIKYILYIDEVVKMFPDSKIVILVRDYHDVVASWRKRGLAGGRAVAYIAAIWNLSYKKALEALERYPDKLKLVRYEDLVSDPENELKEIAVFFDFAYQPLMIDHHKNFHSYIENMRSKVSPDFIRRLEEFHSNTLSPVTKELIGDWKNRLNVQEISIIENICGNTGNRLGYTRTLPVKPLTAGERIAVVKAVFNKLVYLDVYVRTPLHLKAIIKKFRPNKIQE